MYRTTVFEVAADLGWTMPELAHKTELPIWTLRHLKQRGGIGMTARTMEGIRRPFPNLMFEHLFVSVDSHNRQKDSHSLELPAVAHEGETA